MGREIPELDRKGLRNFAWMFSAMVGGLFGLLLPWLFSRHWPWEPWVIAAVFFAWGLIAPNTLRSFYRLWIRFGFVMSMIVTRIVLGAVFYAVILPFGLVFRVRKKDLLDRKWDDKLHSYRVESSARSPIDMEKPF